MYSLALFVHSWVRWVALVAGVGATLAAFGKNERRAEGWGVALSAAVDLQMLVGLLLYLVISPNMAAIRSNFGEAMKVASLRFWAVEHVTIMIVAVMLVHVGRVLARKAATPQGRRRRLIMCFGFATILMIVGTPWPGTPAGRPLFRV
jgi:hypothetical protein